MTYYTLKQLKIFIAVANHASISSAARALHLSQPAVSQQIHKLETQLAKILFEFIGKKIYLTHEGNILLEYAKKIIEQADLFEQACFSAHHEINGKLKVAVGISLQRVFFKAIAQFISQHPSVQFEFGDGDRATQLKHLYENKVDFYLVVHPVNQIKYTSEKIVDLPMTFIMSPQHHLANKNRITSADLAEETFIICHEGSANYDQLNSLLKKRRNSPWLIQINDQNAIKSAVMANLGISVLPDSMLEFELKHNLLKSFVIADYTNPVTGAFWVQHVDKQLSPTAEAFKSFLFNQGFR
ncbi:LysR family transcriptional regulator [Legionella dresdenensis]|uniref:LysR family transcriptional regulator n=1 Tax=Legionella dresdenensis TaxID=450200 RepID=A0ABV8CH54_9GAMM